MKFTWPYRIFLLLLVVASVVMLGIHLNKQGTTNNNVSVTTPPANLSFAAPMVQVPETQPVQITVQASEVKAADVYVQASEVKAADVNVTVSAMFPGLDVQAILDEMADFEASAENVTSTADVTSAADVMD